MIDIDGITNALHSHVAASGYFDSVNGHEPKSAPGEGLSAAIWFNLFRPAQSSGLSSSSVVVTMNIRCMSSMLAQPMDAIDPNLVKAADYLCNELASDFSLGSVVRSVDVRGMDSEGITAESGYISISEKMFRIIDIVVPVIVNDAWTESP